MAYIIFIILLIIFIRRYMKKKQAEQPKNLNKELIRVWDTTLLDWENISYPDCYFERIFWGFLKEEDPNMSDECVKEKMTSLIETLQSASTCCNALLKSLKELPDNSLFFSSAEEWAEYDRVFKEKADLQISNEIITLLPIYAWQKRTFEWLSDLFQFYAVKIHPHLKSILYNLAEDSKKDGQEWMLAQKKHVECYESFKFFIELKYQELIIAYPEYQNEEIHHSLIQFAEKRYLALKSWQTFYMETLHNIVENSPIIDWVKKYTKCRKEMKNYKASDFIKYGVSSFSSIYQIDDFSEKEIERIVSLYKQGQIHGVYLKSKDPKYQAKA